MGLFDKLKIKDKEEGIGWYINKQRGYVELGEDYMKLKVKFPKSEHILFYKDITKIERKYDVVIELKTNSAEYTLKPVGFGDAKQSLSDETYAQLLNKISQCK